MKYLKAFQNKEELIDYKELSEYKNDLVSYVISDDDVYLDDTPYIVQYFYQPFEVLPPEEGEAPYVIHFFYGRISTREQFKSYVKNITVDDNPLDLDKFIIRQFSNFGWYMFYYPFENLSEGQHVIKINFNTVPLEDSLILGEYSYYNNITLTDFIITDKNDAGLYYQNTLPRKIVINNTSLQTLNSHYLEYRSLQTIKVNNKNPYLYTNEDNNILVSIDENNKKTLLLMTTDAEIPDDINFIKLPVWTELYFDTLTLPSTLQEFKDYEGEEGEIWEIPHLMCKELINNSQLTQEDIDNHIVIDPTFTFYQNKKYISFYNSEENYTIYTNYKALDENETIYIPDNIENLILNFQFAGLDYEYMANELIIPNNVISINDRAFQNCASLTSVTIGDGVTSIGGSTFFRCTSLANVTIGSGVTSIGESAFSDCTSLTSITIPDNVTSIGKNAFSGCTSLTSIIIPDSVTSISESAFKGCTSLTNVILGSGVTSIPQYTFSGCTSLSSITIPDSVVDVNSTAFDDCALLPTENNIRYADKCAIRVIDKTLSTYTLKEDTKILSSSLFQSCTSLTSMILPNSLTSIGRYAFNGCSGLTTINIPDNVTYIGLYAFQNCKSLTSITIPDNVTSIGIDAFNGCSGLTNVTIGNGLTSIDSSLFQGCTSLSSITIGSGVTTIGSQVFQGCTSLSSITIPASVTNIKDSAFRYCSGLTSITSSATTAPTITRYTFQGVKSNGTLNVPQGSSGYDVWMQTSSYYLGYYGWTMV